MNSKRIFKVNVLMASAIYALTSGLAAADDTEIFFNTAYKATTKPNILFIMDTSGSMGSRPDGVSSGPKKIEIVQDALKQILGSTNNVNVGLSRFTVPGGPILYPVTDIDKPANPLISSSVSANADDAEEATNGVVTIDSTDLDILEESGHAKWVAVRFPNMNIPQGVKIEAAKISFTARGNSSGYLNVRLRGESADNAAQFNSTPLNISSRSKTSAFVDWSPVSFTDGAKYSSPDISSIVEEIVKRPNWCGGNALVIMMSRQDAGALSRVVQSYEGAVAQTGSEGAAATALAAKLTVKFNGTLPSGATGCYSNTVSSDIITTLDDVEQLSNNSASTNATALDIINNNLVGLRFQKVNVPQNAQLVSARLEVRSRNNYTGDTFFTLRGIKTGDFTGFTPANNFLTNLQTSSGTSATAALSYGPWTSGNRFSQTGSFNNVLTEIFSQPSWAAGNSLGIVLTRTSGTTKIFSSIDDGATRAAKLIISFKANYSGATFTVRDELKSAVDGLVASGWTPISDTLLEAGLYYRGDAAYFGKTRKNSSSNRVSHPDSYTGGTHNIPVNCDPELDPSNSACAGETISGTAVYKSPITDSCQSNHIVFLTDGEPTWHDPNTSAQYKTWSGKTCTAGNGQSSTAGKNGDDCTIKIAGFLNQEDQSGLPSKQSVKTHFIGFDISLPFLKNAAAAGGGGYYEASDTAGLVTSFQQIINTILQSNATFVSAGISVNQSNRLKHLDQLYFSLFGPTLSPRWPGNVKRYRLASDAILDENNALAINPVNDQFADTAQSYWSGFQDGNNPADGGAASKLTNNRPIYTNVSGATTNVTLVVAGNRVTESNSSITEAMLGAASSTERTKILQWARGLDVDDSNSNGSTTDAHKYFGDPLHSQPALVSYKSGAADPVLRLFVGTNAGTLTSINTALGTEYWSFIPRELLGNLKTLRNNIEGTAKPYGLDSSPRVYIEDTNKNGMVDVGTEKAYLYIGMRRGGQSYFAFDISNPDAPKLMFQITNGANYSKLGQTHAAPLISNMRVAGTKRLVMIFSGGYDTTQDVDGAPINDNVGNVLYIADALTGAKIWSSDSISSVASLMTNSIPGGVTAIDLDGNEIVDHVYVADTRAQIFRFDFKGNFDPAVATSYKGGLLASLQPMGATQADNRRFYAEVDVAQAVDSEGRNFVAVAVGSGYREHPLSTAINDRFYVVRDYGVFDNTFPKLVTTNDLVDITDILGDANGDGISDAYAQIEDNDKYGWYLRFADSGEKVIANAAIIQGIVFFTTYLPPSGAAANDCSGGTGSSRLYAVGLADGGAVFDSGVTDPDSPWFGVTCTGADCRSIDMDNATGAFTSLTSILTDDGPGDECPKPSLLSGTSLAGNLDLRQCVRKPKWRYDRQ